MNTVRANLSPALKKQRLHHDHAYAHVKTALDLDDSGQLKAALASYQNGRKALIEAIDLVFTPEEWFVSGIWSMISIENANQILG
jgi:hypothetical protein